MLHDIGDLCGTGDVDGVGTITQPKIVAFVNILELELAKTRMNSGEVTQQLLGGTWVELANGWKPTAIETIVDVNIVHGDDLQPSAQEEDVRNVAVVEMDFLHVPDSGNEVERFHVVVGKVAKFSLVWVATECDAWRASGGCLQGIVETDVDVWIETPAEEVVGSLKLREEGNELFPAVVYMQRWVLS